MKVVELIAAQTVLQEVSGRKMPAKLAYAVAKNIRLITPELEDYEKARVKLLSDNWQLDTELNKYKIPDEDLSKWKEMHEELLETESGYKPYKVNLAFANDVEWTPSELLTLWFIFDGDGSEDLAPKANL